ncbi:beta transducin [Rhypophila decipiens]|uniref:Beta transducin n=1 Tax=Rhypophila decipiens TaxID=261697 RepID=A0AAN7B5C9_9PEZI|nr:beta transducin [Rhypophila decipiens]
MRLLHITSFTLTYFAGGPPPRYVILSHRWENDEVLFEHIRNGVTGQVEAMQGFTKVKGSCAMARSQGYEYIWIDTCCIDKSSSAELSEAINSMFNWYRQATVCYAYLSDADELTWSRSRWFTRGWTLQELISPSWVFFFDRDWDFIGDKSDFCDNIGAITGIPSAVLTHWDSQASRCELCYPGAGGFVRVGPDIEPCSHNREDNLSKILDSCSVAQKLSWASRRETTRIEDTAYCLLGLFGVNMPLLYGEGLRAFVRLQEEIIKISDDQSILAFERTGPEWPFEGQDSLLAESPHYFAGLGKIRMTTPAETTLMTPTAKTLETQVWMCQLLPVPWVMRGDSDLWLGILQCGSGCQGLANIALILEAVDPPDLH